MQLSHPYMTTGKTIALTRRTFVGKVMSLLFNMLSRLVITFLPRSKRLLISWLQSPSTGQVFPFFKKKSLKSNIYHCSYAASQRIDSQFKAHDKDEQCFPSDSVLKNLPASARDTGSIPDLGRSHMSQSN